MHVERYIHSDAGWNRPLPSLPPGSGRGFVLAFGAREVIEAGAALADVARARGDLPLLVASTSGEIAGMDVSDGKLVVTVVRFDTVRVVARRVPVGPNDSSHAVGKALAPRAAAPPHCRKRSRGVDAPAARAHRDGGRGVRLPGRRPLAD